MFSPAMLGGEGFLAIKGLDDELLSFMGLENGIMDTRLGLEEGLRNIPGLNERFLDILGLNPGFVVIMGLDRGFF